MNSLIYVDIIYQSLEFIAERRILAEMKIENRWEKTFSVGKKVNKHTFFYEN